MSFKPKPFDYNKIKLDSFVLVVGKRRYGKSIWARYLLSKLWPYFLDGVYVFSRSKFNQFWQQHVPETRIYESWDPEVAREILEEQKEYIEQCKAVGYPEDSIPFKLVILDDVLGDNAVNLRHDPVLKEIVFMGRHYYLFVIACVQDIKGFGPDIRNNADIIAMTFNTQERTIEAIMDDYGGLFTDKNIIKDMLLNSTQDHHMLIIDQTEARYRPEDAFFITKADPEPPPFRLGGVEFWRESGCDWEQQRKQYKKMPERNRMYYKKIVKSRLKKEKELREQERRIMNHKMVTNSLLLAPVEVREAYYTHARNKDPSCVEKARHLLDSLFVYIPPKKIKMQ